MGIDNWHERYEVLLQHMLKLLPRSSKVRSLSHKHTNSDSWVWIDMSKGSLENKVYESWQMAENAKQGLER